MLPWLPKYPINIATSSLINNSYKLGHLFSIFAMKGNSFACLADKLSHEKLNLREIKTYTSNNLWVNGNPSFYELRL